MSGEISIRKAGLYDVPAIARIERESFDEPWSAGSITNDINAGGNIYVAAAFIGEEPAGYAEIRNVAGEAQIYNIAVAPEFRRMGAGEALLRHIVEKSETDGCRLVTLEVRAGNEAAIELYKKLGFREVGRRKGYYSKGKEDAVLMDRAAGIPEITVETE